MAVVAIINMKGGVGKTTLAANVFREVFRRHSVNTLLIDFDPQYNLSQLLLTQAQYDDARTEGRTILQVMEPPVADSVFATSAVENAKNQPIVVNNYTRKLRYLAATPEIQFQLLPGDFGLARFNLREDVRTLRTPRDRFAELIRTATSEYDLVVLDCNPSSSFLTRCALEVATHLVIPVRPDRFSILGVEMIVDYMENLRSLKAPIPYSIILNDIVRNEVTDIENQLRAHTSFGPNVLVNRLPHSTLLLARSDYSGFAVDRKVSWSQTLRGRLVAVANELVPRIGV